MTAPSHILDHISVKELAENPYLMFQLSPADYHRLQDKIEDHNTRTLPANRAFFSAKNTMFLKNRATQRLYDVTDDIRLIKEKVSDHVNTIMRQVWLDNVDTVSNTQASIRRLNNIAIDRLYEKAVSDVQAHLKYLEDSNGTLNLMDRPTYSAKKGELVLPAYDNNLL